MKRAFTLLLVSLLLAVIVGPGAAGAQSDPAVDGSIAWLRSQQQPDGGFLGFSGSSDGGMTADVALAFAAANIDPARISAGGPSIVDFLTSSAESYGATTGGAAKLATALAAAGLDPRNVGGVNLVKRIKSAFNKETGLYDPQLFVHAYAMIALSAVGEPIPARAIAALEATQADDGSWAFSGSTEPGQGDSNTTSIAIQALVAADARTSPAVEAGLGYLQAAQTDDGSFVYQVGAESPAVGDANSTALAIQAIDAAGQNPNGDRWGHAVDALRRFRNESSGAFRYRDDFPDDNLLATAQVIPALERQALPVEPHDGSRKTTTDARALEPAARSSAHVCIYVEATHHNLCNGFRAYWRSFGGERVFGLPISEEFVEAGVVVQYFERARFEWHPGAAPARYDVLLGRVGYELINTQRTTAHGAEFEYAPESTQASCKFFPSEFDPTKGHNLCNGFRAYWEAFGGLSAFGRPISEELTENGVVVQYFERARLEWHPDADPARYDVRLGRVGAELIEAR